MKQLNIQKLLYTKHIQINITFSQFFIQWIYKLKLHTGNSLYNLYKLTLHTDNSLNNGYTSGHYMQMFFYTMNIQWLYNRYTMDIQWLYNGYTK